MRHRDADDLIDLLGVLADAAHGWQAESGVDDVLLAVVRGATIAVPGVRHASITTVGPSGAPATVAHTDGLIWCADQMQYDTDEGPCLDAAWQHDTVRVDDLGTDHRWPAFAPQAVAIGIRSMLSVHLSVHGESLGALNLASERPGAFGERAEQVGTVFAGHAAVAMAGCRRERDLAG